MRPFGISKRTCFESGVVERTKVLVKDPMDGADSAVSVVGTDLLKNSNMMREGGEGSIELVLTVSARRPSCFMSTLLSPHRTRVSVMTKLQS